MKLTDMKLPPKKKGKDEQPSIPEEREKYPYGLEITLEDDSVKKLGLDVEKMKAGETTEITAKAKVTGIHINETTGGGKEKRINLQIVAMAIGNGGAGSMKEDQEEIEESRKV